MYILIKLMKVYIHSQLLINNVQLTGCELSVYILQNCDRNKEFGCHDVGYIILIGLSIIMTCTVFPIGFCLFYSICNVSDHFKCHCMHARFNPYFSWYLCNSRYYSHNHTLGKVTIKSCGYAIV